MIAKQLTFTDQTWTHYLQTWTYAYDFWKPGIKWFKSIPIILHYTLKSFISNGKPIHI